MVTCGQQRQRPGGDRRAEKLAAIGFHEVGESIMPDFGPGGKKGPKWLFIFCLDLALAAAILLGIGYLPAN